MPSTTGFQLTKRDAEIVHYVYQLRIATLDHLAALTKSSYKTLERRVPKLREEKYLDRLKPQPHKGLYVLGSEGVPLLIEEGYAPQDFAEKRRRETEWKDLGINHALLVASIITKLLLLTRDAPVKLALCQHDSPALWDSVQTPHDGKLPFRPDLYFILQHTERPAGKNKLPFFGEADVGTMSHRKIELKLKAFSAYHQQQRHVAKFGINYFQVAFITQTRGRAENLKQEFYPSMSAAQRRAYHFIPLEDLTLDALLAGVEKPAQPLDAHRPGGKL